MWVLWVVTLPWALSQCHAQTLSEQQAPKVLQKCESRRPHFPCDTPACYAAKRRILRNMDNSTSPCTDFYQFACGGFINRTTIPLGENSVNPFLAVKKSVLNRLRVLLEEPTSPEDSRTVQNMKALYSSCITGAKTGETLPELISLLGNWPVTDPNWESSGTTWENVTYKANELGLFSNSLLQFSVVPRQIDSSVNIIELDQPSLQWERYALVQGIEEDSVKNYISMIKEIVASFDVDPETVHQEVINLVNFEISIAEISIPQEKKTNFRDMFNEMSIEELEITYPDFPWLKYTNEFLSPFSTVNKSEVISLSTPSFFQNLLILLKHSSQRTIVNYIVWRIIASILQYFDDSNQQNPEKWKECMEFANNSIGISLCQ